MARHSIGGSRMHVILSNQQKAALEKVSRATGLTTSEHLRRAVDFYLAGPAQKVTQRPK